MRIYRELWEGIYLALWVIAFISNGWLAFHDWHRLGESVRGRLKNALVTGLLIGAIVVTLKALVG